MLFGLGGHSPKEGEGVVEQWRMRGQGAKVGTSLGDEGFNLGDADFGLGEALSVQRGAIPVVSL